MVSYFNELNNKAANIKDNFCRDEIMRSQLVQEIRDPVVLEKLNNMVSLRAEAVREVYTTTKVCICIFSG